MRTKRKITVKHPTVFSEIFPFVRLMEAPRLIPESQLPELVLEISPPHTAGGDQHDGGTFS